MMTGVGSLGRRDDLKLRLEVLVDTFVVEGLRQEEISDAISDELHGLREALTRDPDPADDNSSSTLKEYPTTGLVALLKTNKLCVL
ncbi:hypothetical protein [Rhizobium herbae]